MYVTFAELFAFAMVLITLIELVYIIMSQKRNNRLRPTVAVISF